jgi:hypothetical protein
VLCGPGMAFPRPLFIFKQSIEQPDSSPVVRGYQGPKQRASGHFSARSADAQRVLCQVNDPRCPGEADVGDTVLGLQAG